MKIFSTHRKKLEPSRRFGSMAFKKKVKLAASYKRAFNPTSVLSLSFLPGNSKWVKTAVVSGVMVFLVLAYFFVISPSLSITTITIKGNIQVSTQQLQDVLTENGDSRLFFIKKNNFFLMTPGRVNQLLTSNIPTIKQVVSFTRHWPNKATIEVTEHTPGFVIQSDSKYFLVDDEGTVVNQIDDPRKLLVVRDDAVENFARGETLPNDKLAPFILSMNKLWSTKISTGIASVKFTAKAANEVQFVTTVGWGVLFDTTRPVTVQLANLAVMLSKQIKPADQPNLAYIDLRLSKWAYYCFKASPCQQQAQPAVDGTEAGAQIDVTP